MECVRVLEILLEYGLFLRVTCTEWVWIQGERGFVIDCRDSMLCFGTRKFG